MFLILNGFPFDTCNTPNACSELWIKAVSSTTSLIKESVADCLYQKHPEDQALSACHIEWQSHDLPFPSLFNVSKTFKATPISNSTNSTNTVLIPFLLGLMTSKKSQEIITSKTNKQKQWSKSDLFITDASLNGVELKLTCWNEWSERVDAVSIGDILCLQSRVIFLFYFILKKA